MIYHIICLDDNGQRKAGTGKGNQIIYRDLKTLKGAILRTLRNQFNQEQDFEIYRGTDIHNLTKVMTYKAYRIGA